MPTRDAALEHAVSWSLRHRHHLLTRSMVKDAGVVTRPGQRKRRLSGAFEKLRGPTTRAAWGLADQSLSSLTNVVLGIIVARSVSQEGFGAFSTVYLVYAFLVLLVRAGTSEVLVVRYSGVPLQRHREGAEVAVGATLVIGILAVPTFVLVSQLFRGSLGSAFLVLAVLLPGLLVQDTWRFVFFSARRPAAATLNDAVWGTSQLLILAVVANYGTISVGSALLAWGGGAYIAAAFGVVQSGMRPRPSGVRAWWHEHRQLIPRFMGEHVFMRGSNQLAFVVIAGITTLGAFGALRAAYLLLGPLKVFFASAIIIAVPEGVRLYRDRPASLVKMALAISVACVTICVVVGAILLALPAPLGAALLGESWQGARELLFPLIVASAAFGLEMGPTLGLRAMAKARESLTARALMAPVRVICATLGALVWGINGAAWGLALGEIFGAALWWQQFLSVAGKARDGEVEQTPVRGDERTGKTAAGEESL